MAASVLLHRAMAYKMIVDVTNEVRRRKGDCLTFSETMRCDECKLPLRVEDTENVLETLLKPIEPCAALVASDSLVAKPPAAALGKVRVLRTEWRYSYKV